MHLAHPDDPHPGSKTGYALHQGVDARWRGLPEHTLPVEPELTFGCADALSVLEDVLNGPASSPRTFGPAGPVQHPLREEDQPLRELNPVLVAPGYRDPAVRHAVKIAALLAVADTAQATDERWTRTGAPAAARAREGRDAIAAFTTQVRAFIRDQPTLTSPPELNPALAQLLHSFVARDDYAELARAHDLLDAAGLNPAEPNPHWHALAALRNLETKRTLVDHVTDALAHPGDPAAQLTAAVRDATTPRGPVNRRSHADVDRDPTRLAAQHDLPAPAARPAPGSRHHR